VTSPKRRAIDTAHAMGFVVDAQRTGLGAPDPSVGRFLDRVAPTSFREYVRGSTEVEEVRAAAQQLAHAWGEELDRVPDGGRLLMVSHSGVIELGAAAAWPGTVAEWGPTLAPLEGIRLQREQRRWVDGEVLRIEE
jgi:broad specificity phosphatase PhoE